MKKLFLSLATVPLFAGFAAANADEPTPSEQPVTVEPTTLDAATLDSITAAGSSTDSQCGCGSVFQFNQPILSPQTQLALNIGILSYQSNQQSAFQGNVND